MTTGFDRRREHGSDDPAVIRSLAATVDDVVTALEARHRLNRDAVLRVTPPFAARMRARLHITDGDGDYDSDGPRPLHVEPQRFLADETPPYPEVDETEDELRARGDYSVDAHREYHASVVESWRETVRSSLLREVVVETAAGPHVVEVKYLGHQSE